MTEHETRTFVAQGVSTFGSAVSEVLTLRDGRQISVVRQPLPGGGLISTHEDVTERKQADALISHMALHDVLTELPNRLKLQDWMRRHLDLIPPGEYVALHCLDLDRFKAVNDTLGHPVGDELLKAVARRLQGCVRGHDLVTRLGGDEFAIVQTSISAPEHAAALALRVIESLSEPFDIDGNHVSIGASVGIALAPSDGRDAVELLKKADLALYSSKAAGRGQYYFFETGMEAKVHARRQLESDLRSALELGQFSLHYQPIVELKEDTIVAMEALLRWKHPVRGDVSPTQFVPILEDIGLIEDVGLWVLEEACKEAAKWPKEISVSVNISAHQFKSASLAFDIAAAIATAGLPSSRLEIEITESALMQNTRETLETLQSIRALGVRIALDDFGTGYSSLSYLQAFPFDKIKIDKSFVQASPTKQETSHILKSIVDLGANLQMVTTAEGVETREQLEQLREDGCTQVQGYYFSHPRSSLELAEILQKDAYKRAS